MFLKSLFGIILPFMTENVRILLIDDDREEFVLLRGFLGVIGKRLSLDWEPNYDRGLAALLRGEHDLCLIDYRLGEDRSGLDLLQEAKLKGIRIPLVLLTAVFDTAVDLQAMKAGAADYLVKSQFGPDQLERSVRYAIERTRVMEELKEQIAKRERLEHMVLQSEKLSAMGLLAAGIAHDLNTPLSIILGSTEELKGSARDPRDKETLETLERAAGRCRQLVEQMLAFSRKEDAAPAEFDLNDAVRSVLPLVAAQAKLQSIAVDHRPPREPLPMRGHRNQIEQVLINLANNGLESMGEGGKLSIELRRAPQGGGDPWAELRVLDTGRGIAPEHLERVWEPFFTTKKPGEGIGLGLSLTMEIVRKHGGRMALESRPGAGTAVTASLPLLR